jgi:hypothetical protein
MTTLVANRQTVAGVYVPTSAIAISVDFHDEMMHVGLADGRIISEPLARFPTLRDATEAERRNYEMESVFIGRVSTKTFP